MTKFAAQHVEDPPNARAGNATQLRLGPSVFHRDHVNKTKNTFSILIIRYRFDHDENLRFTLPLRADRS